MDLHGRGLSGGEMVQMRNRAIYSMPLSLVSLCVLA